MSDKQRLRDAIEAAGVLSVRGSGPIFNDKRKDGTRRLKLYQGGYFPHMPQYLQWLIYDYLKFFFGDRFVTVYVSPGPGMVMDGCDPWFGLGEIQNRASLCVVLRD